MEALKIIKGLEYKLIASNGKKINSNNHYLQFIDTETNLLELAL